MTGFEQYFIELADTHPKWNFVYFYQEVERSRIITGIYYTIGLSILTVFFSVVVGLVGAWMQGSKSKLARLTVQGFIEFFRYTPPFVQLLFFYFAFCFTSLALLGLVLLYRPGILFLMNCAIILRLFIFIIEFIILYIYC